MKLFFAAPESGLPSELTALVAQLSAMHFFMNEVFAAPASGLPSLPTALLSQLSCAKAAPPANAVINPANINFLSMVFSREWLQWSNLILVAAFEQGWKKQVWKNAPPPCYHFHRPLAAEAHISRWRLVRKYLRIRKAAGGYGWAFCCWSLS